MHDRDSSDRIASHLPAPLTNVALMRRGRRNYFGAWVQEFTVMTLLIVATAGAIIAIQSSADHDTFALKYRGRSDVFTTVFSSKMVQDQSPFDPRKGRIVYWEEQRMSFSQLMNRWQPYIAEASHKFHIPTAWIRAVMKMESGGRTMLTENKPITSPVGAVGLMQLMPGTYKEMRQQYRLGANMHDPHDNIMAGAAYLRWLHRKYGFPAMFVAYNDGPGNLEAKQANQRELPVETRNYVARITAMLGKAPLETVATNATGALAKFTRPNGNSVWIDRSSVSSVRAALPGEYTGDVKTVITVGRVKQAVRETVPAAHAALRIEAQYG